MNEYASLILCYVAVGQTVTMSRFSYIGMRASEAREGIAELVKLGKFEVVVDGKKWKRIA